MNPDAAAVKPVSTEEYGIWIFILADMCIFALYFWVFAWDKSQLPDQFALGRESLNTVLGAINMLILLFSSCFMAKAVHWARLGDTRRYLGCIGLTMLCGLGFLIIKVCEYSEKISAGYHLASNVFYRDYFAFTGLHMLHVMIGLCLLSYTLLFGLNSASLQSRKGFVENAGLYWHMVDLLWVVLFTFIYLVP